MTTRPSNASASSSVTYVMEGDGGQSQGPKPAAATSRPGDGTLDRRPSEARGGDPLHQTRSTTQSIKRMVTGPPVNREWYPDYEVKWDGPDDPANPYNWSALKRWWT